MAGRGGKQGSFGGIGTSGGAGRSGYGGFGSSSRQEEYPEPAVSSHVCAIPMGRGGSRPEEYPNLAASSPAGATPRGTGRGDHVVKDGLEHAGSSTDSRQRRGAGGRGRGGRNSMDSIEALGRCMTAILRHRAAEYHLEMKSDGFVLVADLLKLSKKTLTGVPLTAYSEEDVRKAVARDGKQRFGLKEEGDKLFIRANQGHSIKTVESDQLLTLITSPSQIPVCVHGTYERFMSSIWQEGLKRMERNHVHFAIGLPQEDGIISGMRGSAQVLIYLDVEKAMADGMKLYLSVNNVVLTEGLDGVVPTNYFKRVVKKLPGNKEKRLFPPASPDVISGADAQKIENR